MHYSLRRKSLGNEGLALVHAESASAVLLSLLGLGLAATGSFIIYKSIKNERGGNQQPTRPGEQNAPTVYSPVAPEYVHRLGYVVNEYGQRINHMGDVINDRGFVIGRDGEVVIPQPRYVNASGLVVNGNGQLINRTGQLVDEHGQILPQDPHFPPPLDSSNPAFPNTNAEGDPVYPKGNPHSYKGDSAMERTESHVFEVGIKLAEKERRMLVDKQNSITTYRGFTFPDVVPRGCENNQLPINVAYQSVKEHNEDVLSHFVKVLGYKMIESKAGLRLDKKFFKPLLYNPYGHLVHQVYFESRLEIVDGIDVHHGIGPQYSQHRNHVCYSPGCTNYRVHGPAGVFSRIVQTLATGRWFRSA